MTKTISHRVITELVRGIQEAWLATELLDANKESSINF